jgi:hypothetical protein
MSTKGHRHWESKDNEQGRVADVLIFAVAYSIPAHTSRLAGPVAAAGELEAAGVARRNRVSSGRGRAAWRCWTVYQQQQARAIPSYLRYSSARLELSTAAPTPPPPPLIYTSFACALQRRTNPHSSTAACHCILCAHPNRTPSASALASSAERIFLQHILIARESQPLRTIQESLRFHSKVHRGPMPHHSHLSEAPSTTSYGQVIEYIAGEPPLPRNTSSVAA